MQETDAAGHRGELMRTAFGLLSLLLLSGAALAPASAPTLAQVAASPTPPGTASVAKGALPIARKKNRKARRKMATKQATPGEPVARKSCLDLWEPATHMTRRQWARACRSLDERVTTVTLR
jgi:hypothetical protein